MSWASEDPPTRAELREMEVLNRHKRCARALGLSTTGREIMRMFVIQGGEWSVAALAAETGQSPSNVRNAVRRNHKNGLIARGKHGFQLTDFGRGVVTRLHRETTQIVAGERVGFSHELILYYEGVVGTQVPKEAYTVCFQSEI
jgi:DNA-binding MarR family transcriptional regulator